MIDGKNPCDVCDRPCERLSGYDCMFYPCGLKHECWNSECFLNYDSMCMVSAYENCGACEQ